jgi:hypothetical protein
LPGFTLQAFRDAVSGAVSVYRIVFGEWTDFNEPVLIGFEKMPQEGDSLNGISGRDCHDVPTFSMLFPVSMKPPVATPGAGKAKP